MQIGVFAKSFEGDRPATVLAASRDAGFSTVQYNMACSGLGSLPGTISEDAARGSARGQRRDRDRHRRHICHL